MDVPQTLTARTPADLVAAVPCVLGFHPEDSLVMLTFGRRGRSFHARVDLPRDPDDLPELCALLVGAALTNQVEAIVLIAFADEDQPARAALDAVHDALDAADLDVLEMLRADGARWWPMRPGLPPELYAGVPYDLAGHPFSAQSVLAGRVTHRSRAELAATLEPDPRQVAAVQRCLAGRGAPPPRSQRPAEARWLVATLRSYVDSGAEPDTEEVARIVAAVRDITLRDAAWSLVTREDASRHIDLWRAVLRRCPSAWAAPPAALLAFAAWLGGQGALAWCAVDRCREADAGYTMADRVAELLDAALAPDLWPGFDTDDLPDLGLDA